MIWGPQEGVSSPEPGSGDSSLQGLDRSVTWVSVDDGHSLVTFPSHLPPLLCLNSARSRTGTCLPCITQIVVHRLDTEEGMDRLRPHIGTGLRGLGTPPTWTAHVWRVAVKTWDCCWRCALLPSQAAVSSLVPCIPSASHPCSATGPQPDLHSVLGALCVSLQKGVSHRIV